MREIVTTCDRCGKNASRESLQVQEGLATWATAKFHICVDCKADFEAWIATFKARIAKVTA